MPHLIDMVNQQVLLQKNVQNTTLIKISQTKAILLSLSIGKRFELHRWTLASMLGPRTPIIKSKVLSHAHAREFSVKAGPVCQEFG